MHVMQSLLFKKKKAYTDIKIPSDINKLIIKKKKKKKKDLLINQSF